MAAVRGVWLQQWVVGYFDFLDDSMLARVRVRVRGRVRARVRVRVRVRVRDRDRAPRAAWPR